MFDLVQSLPTDVEVYLVGGVLRNAMVRKYHNDTWVQRDYDQIVTKNSQKYVEYLKENGFIFRGIDDIAHKTASKPVVENAKEISYQDNLVFDIHLVDGTSVEDNLLHSTGLSINGFALNLRDVFADDWEKKLICLPGAVESIKQKGILLNDNGYESESNYFFALLRFMGMGFSAPSHEDVIKLLKTTNKLSPERYQRNIAKLTEYLGGADNVVSVVGSLNIDGLDIYNEETTRQLLQQLHN